MARRMTNVRERKQGGYELRFTYEGKRYSVYGATPTECKDAEIEKRKELDAGITGNNITLNNYYNEFIRQKKQHVKVSTVVEYKKQYDNHIKSALGGKCIKNIERRHCLALQKEVSEKVSDTTANIVMVTLHSILKGAVMDEIIMKNPADNIPAIKTDKGKQARTTIHRALTIKETSDVLNDMSDKWEYELFIFLFTTGCRIGEAGALHWGDINYTDNSVFIQRTITKDDESRMIEGDTAKTDSSTRKIPLSSITVEALHSQYNKMTARFGLQTSSDNVFLTTTGLLLYSAVVNAIIERSLKRLAKKKIIIEPFTVHCTRDTFATRCAESGMNMNTLKEILGHSSITMTADLYAHVLPVTKVTELQTVNTGITYTFPTMA
jgi:Site-specific recombinase XerD